MLRSFTNNEPRGARSSVPGRDDLVRQSQVIIRAERFGDIRDDLRPRAEESIRVEGGKLLLQIPERGGRLFHVKLLRLRVAAQPLKRVVHPH